MEPPRRGNAASAHPPAPNNVVTTGVAGGRGGRDLLSTVLVVLLIITSVIASAYLVTRLATNGYDSGAVKKAQYQALFLTNGQVYFGHLTGINNGYVKLTDIYYLQVQQQVQPGQSSTNQQQNVSLAKLGNELHGPEDEMYVTRDQVLFWENLKNSGKVVQAIQTYQKSGGKSQ